MNRSLVLLLGLAAGCASSHATNSASVPKVESPQAVLIELTLAASDAPPTSAPSTQASDRPVVAGVVKLDESFSITSSDHGWSRTASGIVKSLPQADYYRVSVDYHATSAAGGQGTSSTIEIRPGESKQLAGGTMGSVSIKLVAAQ